MVPVYCSFSRILPTTTLGIQSCRHLLGLLLAKEIIQNPLKSNINLADTAHLIIAVVIIVNGNKTHTHKRKYLLDIFSLLNVVFGKSGEILHDNAANLFPLYQVKHPLHIRTVHIFTGKTIIHKFQHIHLA